MMEHDPKDQVHIVDDPCGDLRDRRHRATNDDFRTHMANERTFLAWCRTSIALIVFGFVVERLHLLLEIPSVRSMDTMKQSAELRLVSLFAFALSGIIILVSGYRFLHIRNMIRNGRISISVFPEVMVILSMIAIIGMVILLIIR